MDAHRITGAIKELAGGAQGAAGAVTGDTVTELRGQARQAEGGAERTLASGSTLPVISPATGRCSPCWALVRWPSRSER